MSLNFARPKDGVLWKRLERAERRERVVDVLAA
jgi:hypothetical protein